MIPVGTHGLSCIGEEDYAALALYMGCMAEAIDAQLTTTQTELNLLVDRPCAIVVPNVAQVASSTQTLYDTFAFNNTSFFNIRTGVTDTPVGGISTVLGIGSPAGALTTVPYLRGLYEIGAYALGTNTVPAANALVRLDIMVLDENGDLIDPLSAGGTNNYPTFKTLEETTGGLIRLNGVVTVNLQGTSGVSVATRIFKSGSTVTWATTSHLWARYLGPSDVIEVN